MDEWMNGWMDGLHSRCWIQKASENQGTWNDQMFEQMIHQEIFWSWHGGTLNISCKFPRYLLTQTPRMPSTQMSHTSVPDPVHFQFFLQENLKRMLKKAEGTKIWTSICVSFVSISCLSFPKLKMLHFQILWLTLWASPFNTFTRTQVRKGLLDASKNSWRQTHGIFRMLGFCGFPEKAPIAQPFWFTCPPS